MCSVQVRLPRTFRRFCGLIAQLLQKLSIRATNGPDKLLRVIKGPVGRHLPAGAHRIGFSRSAPQTVPMHRHPAIDRPGALVFVLGAFSHGHIDDGGVDEYGNVRRDRECAWHPIGGSAHRLGDGGGRRSAGA